MEALLPLVVGFVRTGLIGNRLLQAWQARNWLLQQRFLGQEKEYIALKELTDEIATLLGVRIFHMQRLNQTYASGRNENIESRLQEYDEVVKHWNERLTSFYVRLPMLAGYIYAQRLEESIQTELVKTGRVLNLIATKRKSNIHVPKSLNTQVDNELITIQGRAIAYNKFLLNFVESRRAAVYFGTRLKFSSKNLEFFSTWDLIKALFVRNIDSLSILRTPLDS